MQNHPCLREGETGKYADGEKRDKPVGITAHYGQESSRGNGQRPDPDGINEAVVADRKKVGQVIVPRKQASQDRQTAERGVRGQTQDQGGGNAHDVVGPISSQGGGGHLTEHGLARPGADVEANDERSQAEEHHPEKHAKQKLGLLGPGYPRPAKLRDAIGYSLHLGKSATAAGEGL